MLAEIVAPRATIGARPRAGPSLARHRSLGLDVRRQAARREVGREEAIGRLQTGDRFSVIVYDDVVETVIESTPRVGRVAACRRRTPSLDRGPGQHEPLRRVAARLRAAGPSPARDGVNRCLLLTDGLANVGETEPDALATHAAELRARGISTSTFGVGNDFDERLLQELADAGGGHFYYIADAPQIRDAITSEVGETLEIVARDVKLEVTAREDIRVEPISPYRSLVHGNRTVRVGR